MGLYGFFFLKKKKKNSQEKGIFINFKKNFGNFNKKCKFSIFKQKLIIQYNHIKYSNSFTDKSLANNLWQCLEQNEIQFPENPLPLIHFFK